MADTLVVTQWTALSTDGYATPVISTGGGTTYKCRAVRENTLVKDFFGNEAAARTHAWVASTSTANFDQSAQYKLNGSTLGPVLSIEAYPDQDGIHHLEMFWG